MAEPTTPQHWARAIMSALSLVRFPPGAKDFLISVMGQASRNRISRSQIYYVKKRICDKIPNFFVGLDVSTHDHIDPIPIEDGAGVAPIDRAPPQKRIPVMRPKIPGGYAGYYAKGMGVDEGKPKPKPEPEIVFENPMDQVVEE